MMTTTVKNGNDRLRNGNRRRRPSPVQVADIFFISLPQTQYKGFLFTILLLLILFSALRLQHVSSAFIS